jgi:SagB-type dehydrogenase family enzyme
MSGILAASVAPPAEAPSPGNIVRAYHVRTKHRFEAYAAGPGTLDWDAQPAPFRHFDGAPRFSLPLARAAVLKGQQRSPARPDLAALGALLHLSFGITAWKTLGPDRWAVRANPSSGNLHPVEAYVLVAGLPDLADGLYHYLPDAHALELRAAHPRPFAAGPALAVGLSCVMWREAWKYGERAFRYCQLDIGHALAGVHYAAALLGWNVREQPQVGSRTLAGLLGLDRGDEFPGKRVDVTREEPELLAGINLGQQPPDYALGLLSAASAAAEWHGVASQIDRHPMYRWPVLTEVAMATRRADGSPAQALPVSIPRAQPARLILGRRSAQRFDPAHQMPRADFLSLLAALRPLATTRIALILFIHRVEGIVPGVYLLGSADWHAELAARAGRALPEVADLPAADALQCLAPLDPTALRRLARSLHCHQEIAANACLAFGMLTRFDATVALDPAAYRDLYREAGFLGQVLYLEAEAMGLRGTGIGCFFDDPVHELASVADSEFQTLYHFTIGLPVDDGRIETGPAYPALAETQP